MATLTATARPVLLRRPGRWVLAGSVLLAWLIGFAAFHGRLTAYLDTADITPLHQRLNDLNTWIVLHRNSSPIFTYFFNAIRIAIEHLVTFVQALISQPALNVDVPVIGWLGVVAIAGYVAWLFGNVKVSLLAVAGFVFMGLQGLWQESMDTLAMTIASVLISLAIGIPLGVWAGTNDRFNAVITPVLDFMQTMPSFVYLAPLTLFFAIGPASAAIATFIYAMPPVIRITAHGIREVAPETVEAARSLGATRMQILRKVLLPMARRTIILGVNQTVMAALSMVTIAALIGSPGLGQSVIHAMNAVDLGNSFNAGLALVVMAIVLDRVTTAAGMRTRGAVDVRPGGRRRWSVPRRPLAVALGVVVLFCVYESRTFLWAAQFPTQVTLGGRVRSLDLGRAIASGADSMANWVQVHLHVLTDGLKNVVTTVLINNLEQFLGSAPWLLTAAGLITLAAVLGGLRAAVITGICTGLILWTGVWTDAVNTLADTLVATLLVLTFGVVLGVWMGRDPRADRMIRPTLDAAQVMPAFVYLVPFIALFQPGRFSAILAAVVYAAPVSIKIIADGIRGVPAETVEAATAAGSSRWQLITKVQLPMARSSLTLATNQGLIYVLAMVVVGGMVGGGALGIDVVFGFNQTTKYFGKGLAAGLAIVLLGIMLDRTSQAATRRTSRSRID